MTAIEIVNKNNFNKVAEYPITLFSNGDDIEYYFENGKFYVVNGTTTVYEFKINENTGKLENTATFTSSIIQKIRSLAFGEDGYIYLGGTYNIGSLLSYSYVSYNLNTQTEEEVDSLGSFIVPLSMDFDFESGNFWGVVQKQTLPTKYQLELRTPINEFKALFQSTPVTTQFQGVLIAETGILYVLGASNRLYLYNPITGVYWLDRTLVLSGTARSFDDMGDYVAILTR